MRLLICTALLLLIPNAGCSSRAKWTDDEKANSEHYFNSSDSARQATRLMNDAGDKNSIVTVELMKQLLNHYTKAHEEAKLVKDAVLDKAHPELREHFRNEYQKALEMHIAHYTTRINAGPYSDNEQAMILMNQWVDWYNPNKNEIKFPKTKKDK